MQISVQNVLIDRDMVTKVFKQVWAWEVPILQAKFGMGKVALKDIAKHEISGLPDASIEFERLGMAYASDSGSGGTNISFVEMAYGRGTAGIKALAKAIKASAKKPRVSKKKVAKKPEPDSSVDDGDPLDMG